MATIAFDIYGTLIDTQAIGKTLAQWLGDDAIEFARKWREKQLEYSFRRGLMGDYQPFSLCTAQSLDWVCTAMGCDLSAHQRHQVLELYRQLPAYNDVEAALQTLHDSGVDAYAFSNGTRSDVVSLLRSAGIYSYFKDIISVEEAQTFKPDPRVYSLFSSRARAVPESTWLVSGNSFDILGAARAGWRTLWLQRDASTVFDPWDTRPDLICSRLDQGISRLLSAVRTRV